LPMVADDDAQAAQADVAAMETVDDNPARELFEALLSNPALGAAEALALLGTCKAARSVGGSRHSPPSAPSPSTKTASTNGWRVEGWSRTCEVCKPKIRFQGET